MIVIGEILRKDGGFKILSQGEFILREDFQESWEVMATGSHEWLL